MKEKKIETFIYEDLGFPIMLVDVPMKKVYGEWILDINLADFIDEVLHKLIHKPSPITGDELCFIRKYFEMTTTEFGNAFGVTHAAILKWENGQAKIPLATEKCIRLFALECLNGKDEELVKLYREIDIPRLSKQRKSRRIHPPLRFKIKKPLAV